MKNKDFIKKVWTLHIESIIIRFHKKKENNQKGKKMARITVEDCINKVEDHFDLVIVASKRARQIANGAKVEYDGAFITKDDKPAIISLREIAHDAVSVDSLKEDIVKGYRRISDIEEAEDFEEDIEFDSFDDPDAITANTAEEIKEDELSILDEIAEEADKE